MPNGEPRCYLGQLSLADREDTLALILRVFTIKAYTTQEKAEYTRLVAARINRPVQSVVVRLIEIPTVSSDLLAKAQEGMTEGDPTSDKERASEVFTLAQLKTNYKQFVETALGDLLLPPPAILVDYEVTTRVSSATQIKLVYLSERDIEPDAQQLLTQEVQKRFENPEVGVVFERIESAPSTVSFGRNQSQIEAKQAETLDLIGHQLQRFSSLQLKLEAGSDTSEREGMAEERKQAITTYLSDKWKVAPEKIALRPDALQSREAIVKLVHAPPKGEQ
jgi:hypothetical protein